MSLELALLGFLAQRPRSGYELKTRSFAGPLGALWSADQAQIYRTLDRLKDARLVSVTRKRQVGRPDRRIFEITSAGRDALGDTLTTQTPAPPTRDPLLLQLFFGDALSDDALLDVLTARRRSHQERLEDLRARARSIAEDETPTPRAEVLRRTAFDGAIARERATVDWLDDCIDAVNDSSLPGSDPGGIGQRQLFGGQVGV